MTPSWAILHALAAVAPTLIQEPPAPWWLEGGKLLLAALAGGGLAKGIEAVWGGLKAKGEHEINVVEQYDKLRRDALEEREEERAKVDALTAKVRELESHISDLERNARGTAAELELSRAAERACQERLTEISRNVGARLSLGNEKFQDLETRLRALEDLPQPPQGQKGKTGG